MRLHRNEWWAMPGEWAEHLGLPNVGPIWGNYPITKAEFLDRQITYGGSTDECG